MTLKRACFPRRGFFYGMITLVSGAAIGNQTCLLNSKQDDVVFLMPEDAVWLWYDYNHYSHELSLFILCNEDFIKDHDVYKVLILSAAGSVLGSFYPRGISTKSSMMVLSHIRLAGGPQKVFIMFATQFNGQSKIYRSVLEASQIREPFQISSQTHQLLANLGVPVQSFEVFTRTFYPPFSSECQKTDDSCGQHPFAVLQELVTDGHVISCEVTWNEKAWRISDASWFGPVFLVILDGVGRVVHAQKIEAKDRILGRSLVLLQPIQISSIDGLCADLSFLRILLADPARGFVQTMYQIL